MACLALCLTAGLASAFVPAARTTGSGAETGSAAFTATGSGFGLVAFSTLGVSFATSSCFAAGLLEALPSWEWDTSSQKLWEQRYEEIKEYFDE